MRWLIFICTSLFLFTLPLAAEDKVKVIDGDTIHVGKLKYRFLGIDAPEMDQVCKKNQQDIMCGVIAKNALIEKINNSPVTCKIEEVDRYKRLVAECFVKEESLSRYLVRNGYAVAYRRYSIKFVEDEEFAKQNQLGLWSMTFDYPWDYRANKK